MIVALTGVLVDASVPAGGEQEEPYRQDLEVPRGEDVEIQLSVIDQAGAPADLSGLDSIKLVLRKFPPDDEATFIAEAEEVDAAAGTFTIAVTSAQTIDLIEHFAYAFDVELIDGVGLRWQLLPVSQWRVSEIVARPGE